MPIESRQKRCDRSMSATVRPVWWINGIPDRLSEGHRQATIDDHSLAGDVGVAGGDQVTYRASDLAGFGGPAERELAMALVYVAEPGRVQLVHSIHDRHAGADEPRCHRVDEHPARAELDRQGPGRGLQA